MKILPILFLMLCATLHADVPHELNYQGRLLDTNGAPVNGMVTLSVALFDADTGGSALYTEPIGAVAVQEGLYDFTWGSSTSSAILASENAVWLELSIDGAPLTPRQRLVAVPYSIVAGDVAMTGGRLLSEEYKKIQSGVLEHRGGNTSIVFSSTFTQAPHVTLSPQRQPVLNPLSIVSISPTGFSCTAEEASGGSFVVRTLGSVGSNPFTAMAVVNGRPAISYYDHTTVSLKYVHANDARGESWGTPVIVDTGTAKGVWSSLAVIEGRPAISYTEAGTTRLRYVRANDTDGTSWPAPVMVLTNIGWPNSTPLVTVNGNPAMACLLLTGSVFSAAYLRSTDPYGSNWASVVNLGNVDVAGAGPWLAVVNGNPAVSYCDTRTNDLMFVRATDPDGATWGPLQSLDSTGSLASVTSMQIVNGFPAVVYQDSARKQLKYIRANDQNGATWGAPVLLTATGVVSGLHSLSLINNKPAVSYLNIVSNDLVYIEATDADGSTWGTPVHIDASNTGGNYSSMTEVSGEPGIGYIDTGINKLKYTTRQDSPYTWIAVEP